MSLPGALGKDCQEEEDFKRQASGRRRGAHAGFGSMQPTCLEHLVCTRVYKDNFPR